jgi:hypothetical protein
MHKDDGERAIAFCEKPARAHAVSVGCRAQAALAARADAFVDFRNTRVQQFRKHDMPVKYARAVLVGNAQRVAKSGVISSAVRSPLRSSNALVATVVPIFTAVDLLNRYSRYARRYQTGGGFPASAASAYCRDSRIAAYDVTRTAVGFARDNIRESAAAVYPELPAGCNRDCRLCHEGA